MKKKSRWYLLDGLLRRPRRNRVHVMSKLPMTAISQMKPNVVDWVTIGQGKSAGSSASRVPITVDDSIDDAFGTHWQHTQPILYTKIIMLIIYVKWYTSTALGHCFFFNNLNESIFVRISDNCFQRVSVGALRGRVRTLPASCTDSRDEQHVSDWSSWGYWGRGQPDAPPIPPPTASPAPPRYWSLIVL